MRRVAALVCAALALNAYLLYPWLSDTTSDFDALQLYLPLARDLAAQGLAFFTDERSLQAPPFAYAYPAFLGAKQGNVLYDRVAWHEASCSLEQRCRFAVSTSEMARDRGAHEGVGYMQFIALPAWNAE